MKSTRISKVAMILTGGIFCFGSAAMAQNAKWRDYKKPTEKKELEKWKAELKKKLSSDQYNVTQEEGTDYPSNSSGYTQNHNEGIYVDIISGEPLFSSKEKFDSGTGWPSFYQPLMKENIVEKKDEDGSRTEVRSKHADSHLGHVFDDGPKPTGLRYCMNSSSLKFIPKADLEKAGYGEFAKLFKK